MSKNSKNIENMDFLILRILIDIVDMISQLYKSKIKLSQEHRQLIIKYFVTEHNLIKYSIEKLRIDYYIEQEELRMSEIKKYQKRLKGKII